jgi:hypothetical protein
METPGYILLIIIQILLLVGFGFFTDYSDNLKAGNGAQVEEASDLQKYPRMGFEFFCKVIKFNSKFQQISRIFT